MNPISFTPELITAIVAMIFSLLFAYFPALRTWYAGLQSGVKASVMLALLCLTSVAVFILAANGVIVTTEPVTMTLFLKVFFLAVVANQTTYILAPESADVRDAKLSRSE